jgi:hypothetical protein
MMGMVDPLTTPGFQGISPRYNASVGGVDREQDRFFKCSFMSIGSEQYTVHVDFHAVHIFTDLKTNGIPALCHHNGGHPETKE